MDEKKLEIAPPWDVYAGRLEKLFAADSGVKVDYDAEKKHAKVLVDGQGKADAIARLLPSEVVYGNVKLTVEVVPSNDEMSEADAFRVAFAGNPILVEVIEGMGPAKDVAFALFEPDAVQMFEDDISEFGGITTITCKELAESVLQQGDVLVSSAVKPM